MIDGKLFDADHHYSDTARMVEEDAYQALRPVYERAMALGLSPRDVVGFVCRAALDIECDTVLNIRDGVYVPPATKTSEDA